MKDRNVEYPNRYQLNKVTGTDDIYDLVPAPGEVSEAGTILNKSTLLSDTTATKLGFDVSDDPTIDDAFNSINRVGDVKISARTDLDENWALCDGDIINQGDFPELFDVLDYKFTDRLFYSNALSNVQYDVSTGKFMRIVNGILFIWSGRRTGATENNNIEVKYYTNIGINPIEHTLILPCNTVSGPFPAINSLLDIGYANGYYIFFPTDAVSVSNGGWRYGAFIYTNDLSSNTFYLSSGLAASNGYLPNGIIYKNGVYCVSLVQTANNYYCKYFTSSDISFTDSAAFTSGTSIDTSVYRVIVLNNYIINYGERTSQSYGCISAFDGSNMIIVSSPYDGGAFSAISYGDGYYIFIDARGNVYYTTSLTNNSTVIDSGVDILCPDIYYICYNEVDSKFYIYSDINTIKRFSISELLSGTYETVTTKLINSGGLCSDSTSLSPIIYSNNNNVYIFYTPANSIYDLYIITDDSKHLPLLTNDDTYTYIKVK